MYLIGEIWAGGNQLYCGVIFMWFIYLLYGEILRTNNGYVVENFHSNTSHRDYKVVHINEFNHFEIAFV